MLHQRAKGYRGRLSPTGRLTIGYDSANSDRERKFSNEYEVLHNLQTISIEGDEGKVDIFLDDLPASYSSEVESQKEELLVGLSKLKNYHKPSKPRGEDGVKPGQRDSIKASCLILEQIFTKKRLGMLTVTIPPLSTSLNRYLCENWGEFTRKFNQEFSRERMRGGATRKELDYCCVSEIQEERSLARGEIYLHLHILYVATDARDRFYTTPDKMREILSRLLGNVRDEWEELNSTNVPFSPSAPEKINTRAAIDMAMVHTSAIAYMSKYLSKGAKSLKKFASMQLSYLFPRNWWSRAHHLAKFCNSLIIKLPSDICNHIMSLDTDGMDAISQWYSYRLWDGGIEEFKLGICAFMRPQWLASMQYDIQWSNQLHRY